MGIFSSKKKVVVNVTVQQLFEDSAIPDSARQGLIAGIMDQTSLTDNMMEQLTSSIGIRANTGMSWAKRNDYFFGLPTATTKSNIDARNIVMNVIANNVGQAITPIYYTMAPMNSFHYAWTWLVNVHGYNALTNELVGLSNSTGKPCYLKDMIATYTKDSFDFMTETYDLGMVDQLGPPPNSGYTPSNPFTALSGIGPYNKQPTYEVSSVAVEDYVTIKYEFEESPGVIVERGLTLSLSAVDLVTDFHQARYTKADGTQGFFTYQQGSGTYPIVDEVFSMEFDSLGTHYPWVYFRVNGTAVLEIQDENRKAAKDARRYADYLGVSWDMLNDKVEEDPDRADVQQSMLMFGVNPGDKDPNCIEYLFKHFQLLHANAIPAPDKADGLGGRFNAFTSSPSQLHQVQDKFFKMTFQFSGITQNTVPGVIAAKGGYTSEFKQMAQNTQTYFTNEPNGVGQGTVAPLQPAWIYRYQATDSNYIEVIVFGLRADYAVHKKKGFGAGANAPELLIPIDKEVLKTMSLRRKEQVLCQTLNFFVSTAIIIKTPWYASSVFRIIMIVVAVVITVLSAGSAWQTIVAAATLGVTALALTVLSYIVTALAISYGVKLFVKTFGPRLGILAAIAAMAYGAYSTAGSATWGETLVSIGTNLASESSKAYQDMVTDIQQDFVDFQEQAKGMFDDLAEAQEIAGLNGQYVGLEPLEMVYRVPEIRIGEDPDSLYNRTVHAGNIGAASFDLVENFVSYKLELPTLADNQQEEEDDGLAI